MTYRLTLLEDQVKELYSSFGIYRPDQIDLKEIASKLNIWVHIAPFTSKAQRYRGLHSIVLDSRISEPEQWEDFGHELCHVLRHAGNQLNMPKSFKDFQEGKANNFALHFCVPTFMILDSGLPYSWNEALLFIMDTFNVTERFAQRRLERLNAQFMGFNFQKAINNSLLPLTT
jgi:Zn-dependent peptidase ImmA (M78 family)